MLNIVKPMSEVQPHVLLLLRPYQREALQAIRRAEARGLRRLLVALPTGTGKTVIFAHLIRLRPGRALVLAHRDELLQQAADKIARVIPDAEIGLIKGRRNDHEAPIVVASIQTLSRPHRLAQLSRSFTTIIVDEAHHCREDNTYGEVLKALGAFESRGLLILGMTATPERGDRKCLGTIFEEIVYQKSLLEMIQLRYLADLRAIQIRLELDFGELQTQHGDFLEGELEAKLLAAHAPRYVVEAYREHARGRKALVFTPTVHLANRMAEAFCAAGIRAEALSGGTASDYAAQSSDVCTPGRRWWS